jgi:hypothetical protein
MPYRVVQWATGTVGSHALRATIEHPDLELVGVYVYGSDKEGKDAGDLVGLPATGVRATRNRDEILAMDADVVLYTPRLPASVDQLDGDVLALLRSGKNVITPAGYGALRGHGPEYTAKVQAACMAGGATLCGTGVNPDTMLGRIPATLTGLCMDVRHVEMHEIANLTALPHAFFMADLLKFGSTPDELSFDPSGPYYQYLFWVFPEILDDLASKLGMELVRTEFDFGIALATQDLQAALVNIPKGSIAGFRFSMDGYCDTGVRLTYNGWYFVDDNLPDFPKPNDEWQWRIQIHGKPMVAATIDVARTRVAGYEFDGDPCFYATAAVTLRAIPAVCAAPPGFLSPPVFAPYNPRMPVLVS